MGAKAEAVRVELGLAREDCRRAQAAIDRLGAEVRSRDRKIAQLEMESEALREMVQAIALGGPKAGL